jgi:hypothetical protein
MSASKAKLRLGETSNFPWKTRSNGKTGDVSHGVTTPSMYRQKDMCRYCQYLESWIKDLVEVGTKENERQIHDAEAGRNSALEPLAEYVQVWADLVQLHKEGKEEVVKITRYNRVPDHLVGKVQLLKSDSVLLSDTSSAGAGAGKSDQAAAIDRVLKNKADALEKQVESGDETGKTREHLEPNAKKRVKVDDDDRKNFYNAMVSMAQIEQRKLEVQEKAIEQKERTDQRKELQDQLDKYMGYLMNPQLNQTIKTNYEIMVLNIQAQLQALTQPVLPAFTSPPTTPAVTTPSSHAWSHCASSRVSPAGTASPSPAKCLEMDGVPP